MLHTLGGGVGVALALGGGIGVDCGAGSRASAAAKASEPKVRSNPTYLVAVPGECCVDEKKKESWEKMFSRAAKWVTWSPLWWWSMVESRWTHSETVGGWGKKTN
jgi:hypothetical protein